MRLPHLIPKRSRRQKALEHHGAPPEERNRETHSLRPPPEGRNKETQPLWQREHGSLVGACARELTCVPDPSSPPRRRGIAGRIAAAACSSSALRRPPAAASPTAHAPRASSEPRRTTAGTAADLRRCARQKAIKAMGRASGKGRPRPSSLNPRGHPLIQMLNSTFLFWIFFFQKKVQMPYGHLRASALFFA